MMKLPQLLVALAGVIVSIVLTLQGATFSYVVSIERRISRLEAFQSSPGRTAGAAPQRAQAGTMNPFVVGLGAAVKTKAKAQAYQDVIFHIPKGRNVTVIREGESIIVRRRIDPAARRRAVAALRANIKRNRAKRSGPTATELIRELRDHGERG
jgi:hypothetical protein